MPVSINGTGSITGLSLYPCFSAYRSTAQSIPSATLTKLQLNTEEFDLTNAFDNVTNFRFLPNIAGYYQINGQVSLSAGTTGSAFLTYLYKNGSLVKRGTLSYLSSGDGAHSQVNALIYLNGTTDYIELWCYQGTAGALNTGVYTAGAENRLDGYLVRLA